MQKEYLMPGIERIVLDNGLTVLFKEHLPDPKNVAILRFGGGSIIDKNEGHAGTSHLTEHLMFKSQKVRELVRYLENQGAEIDACTSLIDTEVWIRTRPEQLSELLKIPYQLINNFKYDANEFERERKVVLDELEDFKDNPSYQAESLLFLPTLLGDNPFGRPVEGTFESVQKITKEQTEKIRQKYYVPNNGAIAVVGKFEREKILEVIRQTYGAMEPKPIPLPPEIKIDLTNVRISKALSRKTQSSQVYLCLGYKVPGTLHEDVYKLRLLQTILSSGISSRIFIALRENRGIGYKVGVDYMEFPHLGVFFACVDGFYKKRFSEAVKAILGEFGNLKRKLVSEEELQGAKEKLVSCHEDNMVNPHYVANEILDKKFQKELHDFRKLPHHIRNITNRQIRETANNYLTDNYTLIALVPEDFNPF